ncbi:MAG: heme exporter protein CcmD [Hyphomicrobium sp.]
MDLGPHAAFIWLSYGIFAAVLAALTGWLWLDGKRQAQALSDLESRGVKRRSARALDANSNGTV